MDYQNKRQAFVDNLVNLLSAKDLCKAFFPSDFTLSWQIVYGCEIIPNYVPPFAQKGCSPRVVVKCGDNFLRYSKGPVQGFFWDMYGDDFQEIGWAFRAMIEAPHPHWRPPSYD